MENESTPDKVGGGDWRQETQSLEERLSADTKEKDKLREEKEKMRWQAEKLEEEREQERGKNGQHNPESSSTS